MKNIILGFSFLILSSRAFSQTNIECKVSAQLQFSVAFDPVKKTFQVVEIQNGTESDFSGFALVPYNKDEIKGSDEILALAKIANVDPNLINSGNFYFMAIAKDDTSEGLFEFVDANGKSLGVAAYLENVGHACL